MEIATPEKKSELQLRKTKMGMPMPTRWAPDAIKKLCKAIAVNCPDDTPAVVLFKGGGLCMMAGTPFRRRMRETVTRRSCKRKQCRD